MKLQEAAATLRAYNEWRRDNSGKVPFVDPVLIGHAIDVACDAVDALVESDRLHRERAAA